MDSNKLAKIELSALPHSPAAQIAVMSVDRCGCGKSSQHDLTLQAEKRFLKNLVQHHVSKLRNHEDANLKLTGRIICWRLQMYITTPIS